MAHDQSEEISLFTRAPHPYTSASRDDGSSSDDTEATSGSHYDDGSGHRDSYQNASRATRPSRLPEDTDNDDVKQTGIRYNNTELRKAYFRSVRLTSK